MDILFWSGGKDSYLSYYFYNTSFPEGPITLLTTFNEETGIVPHQKIPISRIKEQADRLDVGIHTVSLPPECPNDIYLQKVNEALNKFKNNSKWLIFGDRLAPEIQNWREENFNKLGYKCYFPIEEKSTDKLLAVLQQQPVEVRISAVQDEFKSYIKAGELYDLNFVKQLPEGIDPMGEGGEFHTEVIIDL